MEKPVECNLSIGDHPGTKQLELSKHRDVLHRSKTRKVKIKHRTGYLFPLCQILELVKNTRKCTARNQTLSISSLAHETGPCFAWNSLPSLALISGWLGLSISNELCSHIGSFQCICSPLLAISRACLQSRHKVDMKLSVGQKSYLSWQCCKYISYGNINSSLSFSSHIEALLKATFAGQCAREECATPWEGSDCEVRHHLLSKFATALLNQGWFARGIQWLAAPEQAQNFRHLYKKVFPHAGLSLCCIHNSGRFPCFYILPCMRWNMFF